MSIPQALEASPDTSWLRQAVIAAGVIISAMEKPSATVSGVEPIHGLAPAAVARTAAHTTGSQRRVLAAPRRQAMTRAAAVAGIPTNEGRATQTEWWATPYVVQAAPLIVEFARAAMLTPAAVRTRRSFSHCGIVQANAKTTLLAPITVEMSMTCFPLPEFRRTAARPTRPLSAGVPSRSASTAWSAMQRDERRFVTARGRGLVWRNHKLSDNLPPNPLVPVGDDASRSDVDLRRGTRGVVCAGQAAFPGAWSGRRARRRPSLGRLERSGEGVGVGRLTRGSPAPSQEVCVV